MSVCQRNDKGNNLKRGLLVECSGIRRFCKARQSALSMSTEAGPAPRILVLTPSRGIQLAICGARLPYLTGWNLHTLKECEGHCLAPHKGEGAL
eukprot:243806-Pelagomonas_calceolata.AAC.3